MPTHSPNADNQPIGLGPGAWASPRPVRSDQAESPHRGGSRSLTLRLPQFGFIVATRAALGVGIGLLLSARLPEGRRRAIGTALVAIGAASTIPAIRLLRRQISR